MLHWLKLTLRRNDVNFRCNYTNLREIPGILDILLDSTYI